jgi:hypothetical protein
MKGPALELKFVGRKNEVKGLSAAVRSRQSRLVTGAPGIGKTRLVAESLIRSGQPFVRIERAPVLHDLLARLAQELGCRSNRFSDVARAPTLHLKPLVLGELRDNPRCVIVEDVGNADPRMYRFLQELYYVPGSCLVVTARLREAVGHLRKLLWDPRETIELPPLTNAESLSLFEEASRIFGLESLDIEDFRQKAIRAARGNPGQIVAMCRLAREPEYHYGRRIKFLPLRIDALTGFVA